MDSWVRVQEFSFICFLYFGFSKVSRFFNFSYDFYGRVWSENGNFSNSNPMEFFLKISRIQICSKNVEDRMSSDSNSNFVTSLAAATVTLVIHQSSVPESARISHFARISTNKTSLARQLVSQITRMLGHSYLKVPLYIYILKIKLFLKKIGCFVTFNYLLWYFRFLPFNLHFLVFTLRNPCV